MQQSQKEYDPFEIPANIEIAIKHQKATRCGTPVEKSEICPCCGREIDQDLKELSVSTIDLAFLGQGIPLYFQFMQQMISIVIFVMLVMGIYSLVTNSLGENCINGDSALLKLYKTQETCQKNCPSTDEDFKKIIAILGTENCNTICKQYSDVCTNVSSSQISLSNKQLDNEYKEIQAVLVLCCVVCFKIIMVIFQRHQKLTSNECDRGLTSASDFTVMLTKLPSNQYTEAELNEALLQFCKTIDTIQEFEIAKITIAYDIHEYIDMIRTKTSLEKEYQLNEVHKKANNKFPESVTEESQKQALIKIEEYEKELEKIETNIQQKQFTKTTQVAFVTLQTKLQLEALVEYTKLSYWEMAWVIVIHWFSKTYNRGFYFKGNLITIKRAPEPDDVFWENCGYNINYKIKWRTFSWIITIFLLIFSFFALFGLNYVQSTYLGDKDINYVLLTILSLIISFIISFINGMIYFSITKLGIKEKHYTKTHYDVSVATKLIYVQFVNSGLLILATNILVQGLNTDSLDQDLQLQRLAFTRPGGVAYDAFIITLINALFTSFLSFFDIFYLLKLNSQRKLKSNKNNTSTQTEANTIFEGPQVYLYDNYTYVCKTIWITFLFAPLVPICLLFGIFGLFVYYWVQKYLLLRRRSRPPLQSNYLNREMSDLIDFSPILLAAGQLWVDYVFESSRTAKIINLISIGLSGLEIFIPFERIAKKFITWPDDPNDNIRYTDKWHELPNDYDRANPVTRQQAIINFLKFKKSIENQKNNDHELDQTQTIKALREYAQIGGEQRFTQAKLAMKLKILKSNTAFKAGAHLLQQIHHQNPQTQLINHHQQPTEQEQQNLLEQQRYIHQIENIQQQIVQTQQPQQQFTQAQSQINAYQNPQQYVPPPQYPGQQQQYPQQYQYPQIQQQYPYQQPNFPQQYPQQPNYGQQQYYQQNPY